MAKATKQFVCQECGSAQAKWAGRCSVCGTWNSLIEETTATATSSSGQPLTVQALRTQVRTKSTPRLLTGIDEFDRVLGGGIVPGSLTLLAGEPGIGKSTLLLEVASKLAAGQPVLYISGEESFEQLHMRASRLGLGNAKTEVANTTNADDVAATVASGKYNLVIVDSIQTISTGATSSAAGTISQITATTQLFLNLANQTKTAIILSGHVTKEGNIAGPKLMEHIVDVVLALEGERFGHFKLLRGVKNRFGSTYEVGIFEMQADGLKPVSNPSQAFLNERTVADGSVVLATLEGTRPLLVEVQALVTPSPFGYPKRTAVGFDPNRLSLLLAVLSRRAGLRVGASDVYVNVVGGLKLNEPAADLAVALAIASAAKAKPIPPKTVVYGEVGLSGEIRSVARPQERLKEAKKLGFTKAIAPPAKVVGIHGVNTLDQAVKAALS